MARLRNLWASVPAQDATGVRNQAFWRTLVSIYGLKAVTITANLISVPLAAGHLGPERYGLWLAMGSFIGLLGLFEFGLGNNLTTQLAQARGREDMAACARHLSATLWSVLAAALGLLAMFLLVLPWLDWAAIFNVTGQVAAAEAPHAAFLIGLIAATQLVAGLCGRIYAGLQQGYLGSLWQAGSTAAGLIALIVASHLKGGLVALMIAMGLVPAMVQLIGLAWVLRTAEYGQLLPPARLLRADLRAVIGGSALMFVVNLQSMFWLSKDNLLIAHAVSLDEVGRYNTAWRIFMAFFGVSVGAIVSALWPGFADAFCRNHLNWVREKILSGLVAGAGLMLVFGLCSVAFGHEFLKWYVGAELAAAPSLLAALSLWFVVLALVNILGSAFMGNGNVGVIAIGGTVGGLVSVPFSLWAMASFGIVGLPLSNVVLLLAFQLLPLALQARRHSWL